MATGIDYSEVEKALEAIGKRMPDLYKFVGYTRQSDNGYKKIGYIPIKHAQKIADFFGVSKIDVIDGNIVDKIKSCAEIQTVHDTVAIPIIPAGAGAEAFADTGDVEKVYIERRLLPSNIISKINEHTMMIRVVGNSMQPKINENDVLFIDMVHGREFVMADGIYLVRYGDTVQIKQVQFFGNGEINLISLNPDYPVYNPAKDGLDWEILGKPFMRWGVEYFAPLEITA